MLKIISIEVEKLFGTKSFKYEFNSCLPKVMAGSNGFGKSSLLKLVSKYLNYGCEDFYISSDDRIEEEFKTLTINFEGGKSIAIVNENDSKIVKFLANNVAENEIDISKNNTSDTYHSILCNHLEITNSVGYPCVFIRANRAAPSKDFWNIIHRNKKIIKNCLGIVESIKSLNDFESNNEYFTKTFNSLISEYDKSLEKANLLLELINRKIILVDESLIEKVNNELTNFYINKDEQKKICFEENRLFVRSNNELLSLGELSTGEINLIIILFALYSLKSKYILIDEPEISLHLTWQKKLFKLFRDIEPSNDLLISTHSIYMIDEKLECGGILTIL